MFLLLSVLLCASAVVAQDGIIDTISNNSDLSSLHTHISKLPDFASWLDAQENVTFLAPDNAAFEKLVGLTTGTPQNVTDSLLTYHVLPGVHSQFPSGTLEYFHTALNGSGTSANVTDGQMIMAQGSQFSNLSTFWSGVGQTSSTVGEPVVSSQGVIHVVDTVLIQPQNFSYTVEESALFGTSPFVDAEITTDSNSKTTKTSIDRLSDVTVFLPMNYAFDEIGTAVGNWSVKEFRRILSYHVVDRVLVIDADAGVTPVGKYRTQEGTEVTVHSKNGYAYVNNAKVVASPGWTFNGGLIYMIYGVLNPDNSTVSPDVTDSGIAFAGATFKTNLVFPHPQHGLSTGEKAAVGTAVPVVVILASLLGFGLFYRPRRRIPKDQIQVVSDGYQLSDYHPHPSQKNLTSNVAEVGRGGANG